MQVSRFVNSQTPLQTDNSVQITVVSVLAAALACVLAAPFGTQRLELPS